MAVKIFNATETEYTGTTSSDLIIGNNLGNFIDGGDGDDVIFGGAGDDTLLGGEGNDAIYGGNGNNIIDLGNGNNIAIGGNNNDFILAGDGNDLLIGAAGDDNLNGGEGDDILSGGAGLDIVAGGGSTTGDETVAGDVYFVSSDDITYGADGNDTFRIGSEFEGLTFIDGGVAELDNTGSDALYVELETDEDTGALFALDTSTNTAVQITTLAQSLLAETDVRLNLVTRPGSSALSTFASSIAGYNAVDTLEFTQSGDFSESLAFTGIERIEVASGKNITLSAEQISNNNESLDLGSINPGTHFYGVAGGPKESVTVIVDNFADATFTPAATVVGATETTYSAADFQLDDATVADLFHNIDAIYDATSGVAGSYVRIDGSNNDETTYGSDGVDNATMRLGNDVYTVTAVTTCLLVLVVQISFMAMLAMTSLQLTVLVAVYKAHLASLMMAMQNG